jgi:glycosyltransferase involved in cell wall biosynthesis
MMASGLSRSRIPDAPILFFLPAHDEEASVAGVLARMPASIDGHPVLVVVIDDGSTDATASVVKAAGVAVESFPANRGLGAAVRRGLGLGVEAGAAAVVFCDADGEYAPEELDRLVAPILAGEADYVIGSRFAGEARQMRAHRWFGNRVLTLVVRALTRLPVTDGQSGYRAFSPEAAADAEVIHDFNYAQVLTLDLVRKGYRYREVPISYHFRTEGTSFIRLVPYLRKVVPAIWREMTDRGPSPAQSSTTKSRNEARDRSQAA